MPIEGEQLPVRSLRAAGRPWGGIAGDAFVGTLAASLARGDEIRTAIEAANNEAARIVSTPEADRQQRQDAPQRP